MLVAYTQAELCILKFLKLNVQIRPVFADSVTIIKFYLQQYNTVTVAMHVGNVLFAFVMLQYLCLLVRDQKYNTKGQMHIQGASKRKTLSMQQSNGTNRKTHV